MSFQKAASNRPTMKKMFDVFIVFFKDLFLKIVILVFVETLFNVFFSLLGFSVVSDSQGADFVSSMPFSEDSNSQGSEGPVKRLKTSD